MTSSPAEHGPTLGADGPDAAAQQRVARWSVRLRAAAMAVGLIGCLLSGLAWWHAARVEARDFQSQIERAALRAAAQVGSRFQHHVDVLMSFKALFRSSTEVTRIDFHEHFVTLDPARRYPGMLGVQFAPRVKAADLPSFEASVRGDRSMAAAGYPAYRVFPPGPRAEYVPVLFNEPMAGNEAAFGHDNAAEPTRRAVLEQARDSGLPVASPPLTLLQGSGHERGFVVRVPIYRRGASVATLAERRDAYAGQVSGIFRMDQFLAELVPEARRAGHRLRVYDLGPAAAEGAGTSRAAAVAAGSEQLIFDTGPVASTPTAPTATRSATPAVARHDQELQLAGRRWRVEVSGVPPLWLGQRDPLLVLGCGLALTLALSSTLMGLSQLQRRASDMAQRLSRRARESEARRRAVIDQTVDGILTLNDGGDVCSANPATERIFGRPATELIGRSVCELLPELRTAATPPALPETPVETPTPEGAAAPSVLRLAVLSGLTCEMSGRCVHGRELPLDVSISAMVVDGQTQYVAIVRDLSERKASEATIAATQRQLLEVDEMRRVIVQCAPYAIFVLDRRGVVLSMNPAAETLLGYPMEDVVGRQTTEIFHDPEELDARGAQLSARIGRPLHHRLEVVSYDAEHSDIATSEWTLVHRDGDKLTAELTVSPLRDDNGRVVRYLAMAHDVSERRQAENQLQHLALHDALTGLPNRNMLQEQLKAVIARSLREQHPAALMFLDLDRFKKINDSLGHHTGDNVLVEVGRRLREAVRQSDIVARIGGDEFVVLCPVIGAVGDVDRVTAKLMAAFRTPITIDGDELHVTPSIGVALCPDHGADVPTLMRHADQAMYRAKNAGRNAVQIFSAELDRATAESLQLENDLHRALERDELMLYFQPQFECATGRLKGAEALLRWKRGGTLVSPADFIPIAEETGLIVPIGAWVLREACRVAQGWRGAGHDLRIAVNLSGRQLDHPDIVDHVEQALTASELEPRALELEITESMLVRESLRAAQTLDRLRAVGAQVAIDDFGVGYSSFSYLRELPVDRFKIDRSFITAVPQSPGDARLTAALIAMAHRLEVGVVVEGVETEAQLRFLRDHGCDEAQGFHLGRPMPQDAFADLLKALQPAQRPLPLASQPASAASSPPTSTALAHRST